MVQVDVVSDVVCPWCFVGKRRLERGLAALRDAHPGRDLGVRVTFKPFELNPGLPREGIDRAAYRRAKFGGAERVQLMDARLVAVGESVGIHFAFDKIRRTPNTFDAHRLLWLAESFGAQDALAEALFRGYFLDGLNVGDHAVLTDLAAASGIPRERAAGLLAGRAGEPEVRTEEDRAYRSGIQGVPHFSIDGVYQISGAQDSSLIAAAIQDRLGSAAEA
ncbi:MAG TPA: DsbA family oxidoreductase [bacterium]|nr:DsbA family oxidoreductase [bacterium]